MPHLSWASVASAVVIASLVVAPSGVQAQSSPATNVHVVQEGDTLLQIALDANTDVATLVSLNGLDDASELLSIGQSLRLPTARTAAAPTAVSNAATPTGRGASYTISDGDTLWDIAQKFGTTTNTIVQLNHLDDPDHLSIGTVLALPANATSSGSSAAPVAARLAPASPSTPNATASAPSAPKKNVLVSYTVQPGETLNQIAHQFDASPDAIAKATALDDPNKLSVGAVLKVPVPAREHVVSAGENLRDIAAGEKVDLGSLIDFNQLEDPELIRVGQVVLLPVAANQQVAASSATDASNVAASAPSKPTPPPAPAAAPAAPAAPAAAPAASPTKPSATPKPVAPIAVVARPAGAPTDGLVGAGLKFLGSAYVWGGSSPAGFDCSGFVWYVAKQAGKQLNRGMFGQYNSGSHPARDQLQVGDLVFFQNTFAPGLSHNGIYIGNNQFVHAADEAAGVTISNLNTAYWSSHWFGATRLP